MVIQLKMSNRKCSWKKMKPAWYWPHHPANSNWSIEIRGQYHILNTLWHEKGSFTLLYYFTLCYFTSLHFISLYSTSIYFTLLGCSAQTRNFEDLKIMSGSVSKYNTNSSWGAMCYLCPYLESKCVDFVIVFMNNSMSTNLGKGVALSFVFLEVRPILHMYLPKHFDQNIVASYMFKTK